MMFLGYSFLRFKDGHEIRQINPLQTLMDLQYWYQYRNFRTGTAIIQPQHSP